LSEQHVFPPRLDRRRVEKLIEKRLTSGREGEFLDVYEGIFQTVWNRILPTLGSVTMMLVMERTLLATTQRYPMLQTVQVTEQGLSFAGFRRSLTNEAREKAQEALKELVTALLDGLALLTGDVLMQQLLREIEETYEP